MRPAAALSSLVLKELRALLWPAAACAAAMAIPSLVGGFQWPYWAFLIGAPALGAMSLGHEYSSRTLGLLLSQPVSRRHLYASKSLALVLMVSLLASVAYLTIPLPFATRPRLHSLVVWPALSAVCLTPWLTMLTRSAVGGVVFTLAVAAALSGIGGMVWQATGRRESWEAVQMLWIGGVGSMLCAAAAVAGWRTFRRLEVAGDHDAAIAITLPGLLPFRTTYAAGRATRRHPLRHLLTKELRLQQAALALAAIWVAVWLAAVSVAPPWYWEFMGGLTLFYSVLAGALIGASASAEERQLGTLEWQLLVPVRAGIQWFIKAVVVFGLALVLAFGLPATLAHIGALTGRAEPGLRVLQIVTPVVFAAAGGLYVSSLCRSGLVALVTAIPSLYAASLIAVVAVSRLIDTIVRRAPLPPAVASALGGNVMNAVMGTGLLVLVTACAFHNHRRVDRSFRRVALHVVLMAAYILMWAFVASAQVWPPDART